MPCWTPFYSHSLELSSVLDIIKLKYLDAFTLHIWSVQCFVCLFIIIQWGKLTVEHNSTWNWRRHFRRPLFFHWKRSTTSDLADAHPPRPARPRWIEDYDTRRNRTGRHWWGSGARWDRPSCTGPRCRLRGARRGLLLSVEASHRQWPLTFD